MNELISIVVPVYNVEKYLDACIRSILEQTYQNIEIILVDDGATDRSGQMCDCYAQQDQRIKIIHKENGGLSDARNKGVSCASGNYLMFIDSDDVVSPDLVKYLYDLLRDSGADIGICEQVHCYPEQEIIYQKETLRKIFDPEEAIAEMLYQKSFLIAAWGKIFRREYFDDILFPGGMLFEDSAVMHKIFDKAGKIAYGDARLYGYMHREGSITTAEFSKRDCDILKICDDITKDMSGRSEHLQRAARSYHMAAAFRVYMNAPRNGKFDVELENCRKFLKENCNLVLHDPQIRKKMKLALLLYKYARPVMPIVYKRVDRWK